jgi:nicotinate-nucleotide--dimethylbenzimidazole phosphoribosyltransferase
MLPVAVELPEVQPEEEAVGEPEELRVALPPVLEKEAVPECDTEPVKDTANTEGLTAGDAEEEPLWQLLPVAEAVPAPQPAGLPEPVRLPVAEAVPAPAPAEAEPEALTEPLPRLLAEPEAVAEPVLHPVPLRDAVAEPE